MSLRDALLGRPLASSEEAKEELGILTGIAVLGLDALASTAYGPEAALTILRSLGADGLHYFPFIVLAVVLTLSALYFSYRQTISAYPNGGGAYIVANDNLGRTAALWAAVALLLDYLLNVAVGIAAGVAAIISAVPALQPYTLALCLVVLLTLTYINLRGVRESGLTFALPVFGFIGCIGIAIAVGLAYALQANSNPTPIVHPPAIPRATTAVSTWLLLGTFANGCTAMTGVEAVSNGVPLFREPAVPNAQRTLTLIVATLSVFLLGLGYLCPAYHISAMDEQQPGYQTILSQLIAAIAGRGIFYYVAAGSIFIVLTYSAQTSFADFPRVCRLLAEDDYLPPAFANRGRRLVFSHGIILLAIIAGLLLVAFGGVTEKLIPLFAVGAFSAFLFSQAGMVVHWSRRPGPGVRTKLLCNLIGAVATGIALVTIIVAKFIEGAWITIIVAPMLMLLLQRIRHHYDKVTREVTQPLNLQISGDRAPVVIIPITSWNRIVEKAVRFGLLVSNEVIAVHVATEKDNQNRLIELWKEKVQNPAKAAHFTAPTLVIIDSPYRRLYQPILDFVERIRKEKPHRMIAVIIPELVEPHWYEYLLHNMHAARLRTLIDLKGDQQTVVISTPWYLSDS
jgi:amino acid transporter